MESNSKIMDNKSINSYRYRYRYFQVFISGITLDLDSRRFRPERYSEELRKDPVIVTQGLVSQKELETTLYYLKINDRKSCIHLEKFHGQLEQDSKGMIYWNIIMETSKVITKRLLAKRLSAALFKKENQIDSRIKVNSLVNFVKFLREKMADIKRTNLEDKFCPGFVNKDYLTYHELSQNEDVKERLSFISTNQLLKKQLKHGARKQFEKRKL